MSTKFAEATIRGRLGAYTFELFDEQEEYADVTRLSLSRPVVIEWGEQGRDYPDEILKSRTRLKVTDGAEPIRRALRGGFDRRRFRARIRGRGVDWAGFVEPESRQLPYSRRTRPTSIGLLISDDANFAKNEPVANIGEIFGATDDEVQQSGGKLFNGVETGYDRTYEYGFSGGETPYERHISFAELMGCRVYRALSTNEALLHERRATGQGVVGYRLPSGPEAPVPGQVAEPRQDEIEDAEEAFQDVEQAGTIQINLGSEYNIAYPGAAEILQLEGDTLINKNRENKPSINLNIDGAGSNLAKIRFFLGAITPERDLGLRVTYETSVIGGGVSSSLTATLRDGNGNTDSTTGTGDGTLSINPQSSLDPEIDFEGEGIIVSPIRAVYTDGRGTRIETLFSRTTPTGIERIEVDRLNFANVARPGTTPQQYLGGIPYDARRMEHPLFNEDMGFLARTRMIRQYRPFGIQSVQTRVEGLHGPEDLLILEVPEGRGTRRAAFVCGKGRKVNLTAGTTTISDVEIPSDILSTSVL